MNIIYDINLKKVLNKKYLNRDPNTDISEESLSTLGGIIYIINEGVKSLEGIQFATEISGLAINKNVMTDISKVESLSKLTKFLVNNNQISDVSPLSSLLYLDELDLSYNMISDIANLNSLRRVVSLDLSNNQIVDCSKIDMLLQQTIENKNDAKIGSIHLNKQKITHDPIYAIKGKDVEINWSTFGILDRHGVTPQVSHLTGENIEYNSDTNIIKVSNVQKETPIEIEFSTTDEALENPFSGTVSLTIQLIPAVSYVSKRLT